MVFRFSNFSLWKKYIHRFWSTGLYSWSADASTDTLIGLQRSFWVLWPYGHFGHNGHNHHFYHNNILSPIWVSTEASRLQEYSPEFQNRRKYFFHRKKWEKLMTIFSPLLKSWLPLKKSGFSNEKGQP